MRNSEKKLSDLRPEDIKTLHNNLIHSDDDVKLKKYNIEKVKDIHGTTYIRTNGSF